MKNVSASLRLPTRLRWIAGKFLGILAMLAWAGFGTLTSHAAATRVMTEPYLDKFEFYENGLFYWGNDTGNACGGEFRPVSTMGTLEYRGPRFSDFGALHPSLLGATRNYWSPCGPMIPSGVARNDDYIFVCDRNGISRFPAFLSPFVPLPAPQAIGNRFNMNWPGAMLTSDDDLFFVASYDSTVLGQGGNLGRWQVYSLPMTNSTLLTPVQLIAHGGGMQDVFLGRVRKILKMTIRRLSPLGFDIDVPIGIALGDSGALVRFDLFPGILSSRPPRLLANNVADFDVRRETRRTGGGIFIGFETRDHLYAAVNSGSVIGPTSCGDNGRLVEIDATSAAQTQIWPRAGENPGRIQITDVELDNDYIFLTTRPVNGPFPPFGGCSVGQAVIRSKYDRANSFVFGLPGVDPDYAAIELNGGSNLRSDDHWLYFTRSNSIWRIPNNSPPIQLGFAAVGLEAVQVIQDLNNSIRLVEGKRTVVRGYAREVVNTTGSSSWRPVAELHGLLNNQVLPGSPLRADNSPVLLMGSAGTNIVTQRSSAANFYSFTLPDEWVRAGNLQLRFTVNPNALIYESGGNPLADNSASASLTVVRVARPCLVFAAVKTYGAPNYWPWENAAGFQAIMDRAVSLMPVRSFDIRFTTEQISDVEAIGDCGLFCHDPFDLTSNDDWNEALDEMESFDAFEDPPPNCPRTFYVGAIHPNVVNPAWGGLARRPGNVQLAVMNPGGPGPAFFQPYGGVTLAHELGHNLGRQHVNQARDGNGCGTSVPLRPDPSFPTAIHSCNFANTNNLGDPSTIFGFDTLNGTPIPPNGGADIMSYANTTWISPYTYNAMLDALNPSGPPHAPPAVPPAGPYFLLRGTINLATRAVRLRSCYTLPDGAADPNKVSASLTEAMQQNHDYHVRQLDAGGNVLAETGLVLRDTEDGDGVTSPITQFLVKAAGVARVQVTKGATVLAECRASANPPVIRGLAANYDAAGQALAVVIDASDANGDILFHTVQFSNDDGASWRNLRLNSVISKFTTDARRLPGGAACRVRVITTDGFHSAMATSAAFVMGRRSPEILIGGVKDGERVPFGVNREVTAMAVDAEDGALEAGSSYWDIAGPSRVTTTTGRFNLRNLAPGNYTAAVRSTDSDGNTSVASIGFQVLPLVVTDAPAPTLDGDIADAAYAGATPVFFGGNAVARFTHAAGYLYGSFSGMSLGRQGVATSVGLRIDADASGETTAQSGDRAFFVNENGAAWQQAGNGTALVDAANPPAGFKAVVARGLAGWSAEIRIAESLIGGWDHAARLSLELGDVTCISVLFTEICSPSAMPWPASAAANNPSTWIDAYFGELPALANQPPVAITPTSLTADLGTKVFLSGTDSYDPDGDAITYSWVQTAGPAVVFENAATATPCFTLPGGNSPATFQFRLTVNDGSLDSTPAEVVVTGQPIVATTLGVVGGITYSNGVVNGRIVVPLPSGSMATIQASTNLIDWEDLEVQSVGVLPMLIFRDSTAGQYPHRFYRAAGGSPTVTTNAGNALQLDGTGARVDVPHADDLNAWPLTISAWIRTTQTSGAYPGIVTKYRGNSSAGYALALDAGRLSAWYYVDGANYLWDGGVGLDSRFVADGEWHHVAYVVDAAAGRIYLDGNLVNTHFWVGTAGPVTSAEPLRFGVYLDGAGVPFAGEIDDVSLWNRALSDLEVLDLKNFSPDESAANLVGLWRFDEDDSSGTATADNAGAHLGMLENGATRAASTAPIRR